MTRYDAVLVNRRTDPIHAAKPAYTEECLSDLRMDVLRDAVDTGRQVAWEALVSAQLPPSSMP